MTSNSAVGKIRTHVADVLAFRGTHYNRSLLQDWTKVICPVYDIIPAGQHEQMYAQSPFNFVRLEAGRELPQDTPQDSKYSRAAATLDEWLERGVFETDADAAIYVHDHYFHFAGREYKRRGLVARVRLEEWERMIVRPHESTFADARSDRLSLLWAIQANTSSILSLYEDRGKDIGRLLADATTSPPAMDLPARDGEGHRVWALTDPATVRQISGQMRSLPLYVADGHHRYESALAHRRQKRAATPSAGDMPFDFVMMTLVDFEDPGLLILPPHRLVRGISRPAYGDLRRRLELLFHIQELDGNAPGVWEMVDKSRQSDGGPRLVLHGLSKGSILVLEAISLESLAPMMPQFHSDLYKRLEVSIIDHAILENLLGLNHENDKVNLGYSYDRTDAMNRVLNGEYQLTFLLEPIRAQTIKAIADVSDKMPKKSTYFYPKVPAGLILNRLV
jgi:uncharacterized protein (DUF1015 family)